MAKASCSEVGELRPPSRTSDFPPENWNFSKSQLIYSLLDAHLEQGRGEQVHRYATCILSPYVTCRLPLALSRATWRLCRLPADARAVAISRPPLSGTRQLRSSRIPAWDELIASRSWTLRLRLGRMTNKPRDLRYRYSAQIAR